MKKRYKKRNFLKYDKINCLALIKFIENGGYGFNQFALSNLNKAMCEAGVNLKEVKKYKHKKKHFSYTRGLLDKMNKRLLKLKNDYNFSVLVLEGLFKTRRLLSVNRTVDIHSLINERIEIDKAIKGIRVISNKHLSVYYDALYFYFRCKNIFAIQNIDPGRFIKFKTFPVNKEWSVKKLKTDLKIDRNLDFTPSYSKYVLEVDEKGNIPKNAFLI